MKKEMKLKEYIFRFKTGGFNTVMAKTLRGAKKLAVSEYAYSDTLIVNVDSVHLVTKEELKFEMDSFW